LTQELKKDVSSVFGPLNLQTGDTLYFRVIAGSKYTMQNTTEDAFNSDDPCASYTISLAIPCVINCPTCTPPDAIKISSTEPIATGVVTLCAGESTTLTTNNVVPAQSTWASSAFAGYTLDWYLDGKLQSTLSKTGDKTTSEAAPNTVKNPGVTKDETHTWTVVAYDNLYPTASKCIDSAKIKVTFLAKPVVKSDSIKYCFGLPTATSALPTSTDGTINLLDNSKKALAAAPDLKTMPAGRNVYYYNLTSAAGCQSDTVLFVVNVDTIPTLKVPDVSPFCAGATTRVLPSDTLSKAYTIDWGGKEQNLSKLTGSATPYTYIYKVTDVKSSCVSVPETLSITAKPATKVSVKAVQTCGKTTVTTTLDPTTAATAWTLGGAALATTPTEFTELSTPNSGLLQVVATETGYCADTDTVTISVQAVPKKPTTADVSYLKSQASSFKDVMLTSGDKAAVMNDASTADLEFEWSSDDGATWSTTAPTPTVKDAASPKEEDVTYRVRVTNKTTGCHSDTATVVARIYGAPVPNVSDTAYCVGTTAGALSSNVRINQALAGETYTLKYYDSDKTTELTAGEIPSTTAAGVHTYYATQSSATGGESDKVGFKVTVYGVDTALVAQESYLYCKNDVATALTATVNKTEASYKMSDGLQWSSDGGTTWSATAPTPSTATVGSATYNVKQTYTITASKEVCEGKAVNITVTTSETTDPTGTMSVSYVLADADGNGGKFKDLLGQSATTVDVEAGYTYQYAECDASGAVSGAWSTTVPTPSVPSKSDLNGGSKTIYYAVKRIATAAPNCESGTKVITVTISDSPMPDVTPGYYCEGETIADLGSSVKVNTQKKTADKYELLWYGTTKPASSADYAAGSTTVPATPAATVADSKTPNVMTYYVAQKDKETDAIGTASALVITVYPKPVQTITDPAAVCETAVDLGKSLKYDAVVKTATYNTSYYSDAAGTTALTGSTVTASGAYYVQTAFAVPSATNSGAVCASTVDKITVTVDTLTLQKVIDAQTCPNTAAILTATAGSNAKSVVFDWSGESNSDTKSDAQTPASGSATSKFTTVALAGKAGDTYKYDLKVTAGTCTESQKGIVITIGDGPVEGTLTLEETDNKETGKVYTDTRDNTADPFYTCGNGITATASFTKDATPDYTWSDANGKSVGTGATAKLPGAGIYTITYNNQCATSVKFEVKDASIKDNKLTVTSKVTPSATGKELELCEGEAFSMDLSYTCAEAGTISWTHDGTAATGISGKSVSLPKATPAESGTYAYTITNHGCTATGDTTIKVKPYIQFAPEQYAYVARRDSQLTIKTNITVPASGTPSDISWTESGTSAGTGKDKDLTVTSDHSYLVKMSDADYCPSETTVTVTMDARLKLSAKVDAKMCRGDKGVYLTIDTTGTGKFVYPSKAKITVTETIGSASHTVSGWSKAGDTLKLEVSPSADATYKVDFTYREGEGVDAQSTSASASITVLQPIYITVPTGLSVCSDSALDITLEKLGPTGTTVAWDADATITSGTTGESVTVSPVYESASGLNHNSTKWYYLTASYEGCHDKRDSVKVTVNEPITGTMPTDTTICEGTSVRLDAGSYGATTYEWTTASQASAIGSSQSLSVTPKATTTYTVSMARGKCKATADETVNVNSNPVITSVDSLSYRKVAIMVDASYGTSPYYYSVDKGVSDLSNEKDSLTYSNHTAYVVDAVGCKASYPFSITAPKIKIPDYFSPNGDGTNDGWKIPGIDQTYPNAEITIFDRWGKKIASYKGADEGWDGKYNGHDMPTTDYWYEIQVREIDKTYTGHFTLLRR
jgi:gliding motility-associated-like protein